MAFCTNCGRKLEENQKFCTGCGKLAVKVTSGSPAQNTKLEEKTVQAPIHNIDISTKTNIQSEVQPTVETLTQVKPIVQADAVSSASINPVRSTAQIRQSNQQAKRYNSILKNPVIITLFAVICVLAVLIGVFSKQVKGGYYLIRYNFESDLDKKLDYAGEALSNLNISSTYNAFKETSDELLKQDPNEVESKLNELKAYIKPEDYKKLNLSLDNEKVAAAVKSSNFGEALKDLVKLNADGGNIKDNPKYDTIMFNAIAKATGSKVYDDKEVLKKEANIVFGNLDEDNFDEIIQIKDLAPDNDIEKKYDINLYKIKSDSYAKVDSKQTALYDYLDNYGIYNYDKNNKGLYVSMCTTGYVSSAEVLKVTNSKFSVVGQVGSSDPCEIKDFDDDGIYEIVTTQLDDPYSLFSHAEMPRIVDYYKFSDTNQPMVAKTERHTPDGTVTPSNDSVTVSTAAPAANSDYIFPDSDKRYLTDGEVSFLSKDQLGYARNEIYARHGYVFNTDKYKQYFTSKSWYIPNPSYVAGDNTLNQYEIANCKLIQKYEK